jgi:hypothetical protein
VSFATAEAGLDIEDSVIIPRMTEKTG